MNEENDKHEFNFFLDKQIQQKLLEANEEISTKEAQQFNRQTRESNSTTTVRSKANNGGGVAGNTSASFGNQGPQNGKASQKSLLKELQTINISGWCPDSTITFRKTENDVTIKGKGNPNISNKDVSREFKSSAGGLPQDFVFRHYADPRRYIEQYRREHTCYDTSNSSATKNEFLETRRFYAYNQYSPLAVSIQGTYQQNSTLPSSQQDSLYQQIMEQKLQQALHYAKRDQQKQPINSSYRSSNTQHHKLSKTPTYKPESAQILAPQSETPEGADVKERRRGSSAKDRTSPTVNGFAIPKSVSTKMNGAHKPNSGGISARSSKPPLPGALLDSNIGNQFVSHRLGQNAAGQMRTLDTLASVAGNGHDKQDKGNFSYKHSQTTGLAESVDSLGQSEHLASAHKVNQQPDNPPSPQVHLISTKGESTATSYVPGTESQGESGPSWVKEVGPTDHESGDLRFHKQCLDMTSELKAALSSKESVLNDKRKKRSKMRNHVQKGGANISNDVTGCTDKDGTKANREMEEDKDFEDLLTVTVPVWRHRSMLSVAKINQDKNSDGVLSRVKKKRNAEDKASLSHRRRIQHLIEQSRLKSRFGQLLIGGSLVSEEMGKGDMGESATDLHISPFISEAWTTKDESKPAKYDAEINCTTKPSNIDVFVKVKGLKITNPRLSSLPKHTQFQDSEDDFRGANDVTNPGSLSTNALQSIQETKTESSSLPSSEVKGERNSQSSPENQRLSSLCKQYMDTLKLHAAPAVKISVPHLRYSTVNVVSRSQSMHF